MSAVLDFPVKPELRPYLDAFQRGAGHENEPEWLTNARRSALRRFAELGFPTRRDEGWRYLDLQALQEDPLLPAPLHRVSAKRAAIAQEALAALGIAGGGMRLVIVDGCVERVEADPSGTTWFNRTVNAGGERDQLFEDALCAVSGGLGQPFAALNAALFTDGYILDVPAGAVVDQPIEIIHLATGENPASFHTRSLIRLGEGTQATIVEIHAGKGRYWRNDVARIELARGAVLHRTMLVEEAPEAAHLALTDARLEAGSRLNSFALLLGGRTVRQEANVRLGEGASCRLDGAYIVAGNDEANIVTAVDHAAPGGQTRELIKGVAAGRGHGAFQGRIVVREDAQKTDAHQLSRNLLIGERAVIDTKPELEIYADDVKCSHGASVGDLDEAALFYLRARGIPAEEARHMLIDGFLREAVEGVDDFAIRTHLLRRLATRLATLEGSA